MNNSLAPVARATDGPPAEPHIWSLVAYDSESGKTLSSFGVGQTAHKAYISSTLSRRVGYAAVSAGIIDGPEVSRAIRWLVVDPVGARSKVVYAATSIGARFLSGYRDTRDDLPGVHSLVALRAETPAEAIGALWRGTAAMEGVS